MRFAILSDIHGNLDALQAVFNDIDCESRRGPEPVGQIWCLGDIVGYGPQPGECVRLIRTKATFCVAGNHDRAATKQIDLSAFSEHAAESARWTQEHLGPADLQFLYWLRDLTPVNTFTLAHGSPADPIWEYLTSPDAAAVSFDCFDSYYCVVGHTHLPTIFVQRMTDHVTPGQAIKRVLDPSIALTMATPGGPTRKSLESGQFSLASSRASASVPCERWNPPPGFCPIPAGYRAIINPGSVGQPRDGDNRASYVIFDSARGFEFRRVPYNIHETQRKIRQLGLDERLAERLFAAN